MRQSIALTRLALTMAASCAVFALLRVTETFGRLAIFCHETSCFVEGVLWSLPGYAAMLAIVTTAVLMAAALERAHVGPSVVRIAAFAAAVGSTVTYIVASAVTLDSAWAAAFSGRLNPSPQTPLLPPILLTLTLPLWFSSWMLLGVWIALTSLQSLSLRAPWLLVVVGWIAGVALATLSAAMAYAFDHAAYLVTRAALSVVFLTVAVWALWLAVFLMRLSPRAA